MVPRWSRDGPEDDRTLIAFATGRALRLLQDGRGPTGRVVDDTTGRSLCSLQDVRGAHYRMLASELMTYPLRWQATFALRRVGDVAPHSRLSVAYPLPFA